MRFCLAMFCILACGTAASAQSGVSNQRDAYGNLVRDNGAMSPRGVNQGPVNNGTIRNAPAQPTTSGIASGRVPGR
jgi:hypothetical protein